MVGRGGHEVRQRDDAERAVRLARDAADALLLDGALDLLTAAQFDDGEFVEAAETVRSRLAGSGTRADRRRSAAWTTPTLT